MNDNYAEIIRSGRRVYWRDQMEAAAAMMEACRIMPVRDCLEPLEDLQAAAVAGGVRMDFSDAVYIGWQRVFRLRRIGAATGNRRGRDEPPRLDITD